MATLSHIAESLGISVATVSRALNSSQLVQADLRERVRKRADELGYQRRQTRRQKERLIVTVKVVLPDFGPDLLRASLFNTVDIFTGLKEGLAPSKVNFICESGQCSEKFSPNKKSGSLDAAVFALEAPADELVAELREREIPAVVLGARHDFLTTFQANAVGGLQNLIADLRAADKARLRHFIGLKGGDPVLRAAFEQEEGYSGVLLFDSHDEVNAEDLKKASSRPGAFICEDDLLASRVMRELRSLGKSVPEDHWVAGFGGSALCEAMHPMLTSVRMPLKRLARAAGEALGQRVIEKKSMGSDMLIQGEIFQGASTPILKSAIARPRVMVAN